MLDKLFKYLADEYRFQADKPRLSAKEHSYGFNECSQKLKDYLEAVAVKENRTVPLRWEYVSVFTYYDGLGHSEIGNVKSYIKNALGLDMPKALIEFYKKTNGCSVMNDVFLLFGYKETPSLGGPIPMHFNLVDAKKCGLNEGLINIGYYGANRSPIFMNKKGNIIVYNGNSLFNENSDKTEKLPIAYFEDIEEFIYQEAKRYIKLFTSSPFSKADESMLPNNISEDMKNIKNYY